MATRSLRIGALLLSLVAVACEPKHKPAAPAPAKQNLFVLLPEPEGNPSRIVVKNAAGSQELSQPYQTVRVERADLAPSPPFALDEAGVRRLFGAALDVLPPPEVQFQLYFDEGRDVLTADSEAKIPAILDAIRERHSTAITVTGHTDSTGDPQANYQLGMKRAQRVAGILLGQGVNTSDLFVSSHGESDLLVKTPRGVAEARNRRVEVIVR